MQVCLRLCNALKCIIEATITVMTSESAAKLAHIAIKLKFGTILEADKEVHTYITYN